MRGGLRLSGGEVFPVGRPRHRRVRGLDGVPIRKALAHRSCRETEGTSVPLVRRTRPQVHKLAEVIRQWSSGSHLCRGGADTGVRRAGNVTEQNFIMGQSPL